MSSHSSSYFSDVDSDFDKYFSDEETQAQLDEFNYEKAQQEEVFIAATLPPFDPYAQPSAHNHAQFAPPDEFDFENTLLEGLDEDIKAGMNSCPKDASQGDGQTGQAKAKSKASNLKKALCFNDLSSLNTRMDAYGQPPEYSGHKETKHEVSDYEKSLMAGLTPEEMQLQVQLAKLYFPKNKSEPELPRCFGVKTGPINIVPISKKEEVIDLPYVPSILQNLDDVSFQKPKDTGFSNWYFGFSPDPLPSSPVPDDIREIQSKSELSEADKQRVDEYHHSLFMRTKLGQVREDVRLRYNLP